MLSAPPRRSVMSYRIAAIDVHKRMLAVVVTDVEGAGEYQFERRKFGATPGARRRASGSLAVSEVQRSGFQSRTRRPIAFAIGAVTCGAVCPVHFLAGRSGRPPDWRLLDNRPAFVLRP